MRPDLLALAGRPVIIGAGVARLMVALRLAPEPVVLLSKGPLGTASSSAFAQGGLAASLGDDDDPVLHLADTLAAGDGLCDEAIAKRITRAAPSAIHDLVHLGVRCGPGDRIAAVLLHCMSPLLAQSGHGDRSAMSAFGGKADMART